jgi:hypothetical protein
LLLLLEVEVVVLEVLREEPQGQQEERPLAAQGQQHSLECVYQLLVREVEPEVLELLAQTWLG